jgi:chromosome partitioning protein
MKKALQEQEAQALSLRMDIEKRSEENESLRQLQQELNADLQQSRQEVDHYAGRVRRVLDSEGRIWERPTDGPPPPFRPLGPRKAAIICLMNLKGGVGKTTIAANLGATMASLARDVLLVDLDFQGTLTSLCLNGRTIQTLRDQRRFVQLAFADRPAEPVDVRRAMVQIGDSTAALLAADEDLVNCEQRQMTRWLIGEAPDDIRFRLRRLLHAEEVQSRFDVILLDCPPRLTTASVNALAASDFVLIPTLLDPPSAERVPSLLAWLRRLKDNTELCRDLSVLGVVANQVQQKNELTPRERDVLNMLQQTCADRWGDRVHHFSTTIPRREAFPLAAERHEFAAFDRDLVDVFRDLVKEVDQGMPQLSLAEKGK